MTLARKSGTNISIFAKGNPGSTDFEDTMIASFTAQVTGLGPIQDTGIDGEVEEVQFQTLSTDTRAQIMAKAVTAVTNAIAGG